MLKFTAILYCTLCVCLPTQAQDFFIEIPKQKKNEFAKNFIRIVNTAPTYFEEIKDKPFKQPDSAYLGLTVLKTKVNLKGATNGKIVLDSIPFAEYFFGKYTTTEAAEAAYVNLTNTIAEAMNRKVLFKTEEGAGTSSLVKQTKIAYTKNNGFFLFNIQVQLNKNFIDSSYHLYLKVKAGRPHFYYKIMKNEPINSFMFVSSLRSILTTFHRQNYQGCLGNLIPFYCTKEKRTKDSAYIVYTKTGFQELPNIKAEFENTLSNMRVCMNEDYVYYLPLAHDNHLREVSFIRFEDIEKSNPKTITLSLAQLTKTNYQLELILSYK